MGEAALARPRAPPRRCACSACECGEIAPGDHRQHAGFLAQRLAAPAVAGAIGVDPRASAARSSCGLIGVIGILDERSRPGSAAADRRSDRRRAASTVASMITGRSSPWGAAVRRWRPRNTCQPPVRWGERGWPRQSITARAVDPLAIAGDHPVASSVTAELPVHSAPAGSSRAQGGVEIARGERAIGRRQMPGMAGEAHIVAIVPAGMCETDPSAQRRRAQGRWRTSSSGDCRPAARSPRPASPPVRAAPAPAPPRSARRPARRPQWRYRNRVPTHVTAL